MTSNPTVSAALCGVLMQGLMVVIGKLVPSIGQMPNFYAVAGTVLAALTGAIFAKMSPPVAGGRAATGGAIAGGGSSVVGGLLAVLTAQWPGFQAWQLLFPAISGGVGGGLGGFLGRALK